jgi:uncharacterized protein (TIGR03437 family)
MKGKAEAIAITILIGVVCCRPALAQAPPTIIEIDLENVVEYQGDVYDAKQFAANPNVTPVSGPIKNFREAVGLGDIVAVNGQPAKGLYASGVRQITTTPAPNPGQAIGDVAQTSIRTHTFVILKSDGTPVGSIMCSGLDSGPAPPGSFSALYQSAVLSSSQMRGNYVIVGGTGAFLGARGQLVQRAQALEPNPPRTASLSEDPANRRTNGGGKIQYFLHLIPMSAPQIVTTASGAAVTHSIDFSLVTASKPAAPGEILSVFVTGLGPTVPGVDPGQPFPSSPLSSVNSPVTVTLNGKPAEVLAAVGYPGAVDGYQVNFRVPPDAPKGMAPIQVSAAWIVGSPVNIAIQ